MSIEAFFAGVLFLWVVAYMAGARDAARLFEVFLPGLAL